MKEHSLENNQPVNLNKLNNKFVPLEDYSKAHAHLIIACHDIIIEYQTKIVLLTRDNFPAKDDLWPVGGRIKRGISIIESLK